ncbi:MAG: class I SAM-dependent methyltransferase [Betaproteobacteria bacterium]|nr:MAG: class I SAM-dependent methyltransferase [Betaproteobacteria bacterium]
MRRRCLLAFALFAVPVAAAHAQSSASTGGPDLRSPTQGDEVPYIQTPQAVVDKMLDLAEVGPDDFLIDLGSGDGRIVITAAQERGARGFGIDLDTGLVETSNAAARRAGVAERARFFARDLFDTDLREATVLTMYLLPAVNLQLRPRLLAQLKPGTRVVSHDWDMGEWRPDAKAVLEGLTKPVMPIQASTVYLWIVPAKVAGAWKVQLKGATQESMEIEFAQRFQEISGVARRERGRTLLQSAHLRGAEIRFAVIDETRRQSEPLHFFGRVFGDTMEGTTGAGRRWRAERKNS